MSQLLGLLIFVIKTTGMSKFFEDLLVSYIKDSMREETSNAIKDAIKTRDQRSLEALIGVNPNNNVDGSAFELRDSKKD